MNKLSEVREEKRKYGGLIENVSHIPNPGGVVSAYYRRKAKKANKKGE